MEVRYPWRNISSTPSPHALTDGFQEIFHIITEFGDCVFSHSTRFTRSSISSGIHGNYPNNTEHYMSNIFKGSCIDHINRILTKCSCCMNKSHKSLMFQHIFKYCIFYPLCIMCCYWTIDGRIIRPYKCYVEFELIIVNTNIRLTKSNAKC